MFRAEHFFPVIKSFIYVEGELFLERESVGLFGVEIAIDAGFY